MYKKYIFDSKKYIFDSKKYIFENKKYIFDSKKYIFENEKYIFFPRKIKIGVRIWIFGEKKREKNVLKVHFLAQKCTKSTFFLKKYIFGAKSTFLGQKMY